MAERKKPPQIKNRDKITLEEFADLVRQMRHNQKRVQSGRTEARDLCEMLEGEVDNILDTFYDRQLSLF